MRNRIYLDHAATTPLSAAALRAMMPYLTECCGNASAVYGTGREARKAVEKARRQTAAAIGAEPSEVYFTSGGSESDNLAVKGTAFAMMEKGKHIITTSIEHHAVLNSCGWLEKLGFDVTYIGPDPEGRIDPDNVRRAIRKDTILISVSAANNEIGTIEPVDIVGRIARQEGIVFHIDAVQAVGSIPVDVNAWNADLLSMSAHKFYGPKGVGALYIRSGTRIDPLIHGGSQERRLRAGTENTAGIAGLGQAIEDASAGLADNAKKVSSLRDRLLNGVLFGVPGVRLNGSEKNRLPNNCNVCFEGVDGEALLLRLDLAGIAGSAGSACTAGSRETSHVLKAIGLTESEAKGSLRFTPGHENTAEEIDETVFQIREIVTDLRRMFHG